MKTIKNYYAALVLLVSFAAFSPVTLKAAVNTCSTSSMQPPAGYTITGSYTNSQGVKMVILKYADGKIVHAPLSSIVGAMDVSW